MSKEKVSVTSKDLQAVLERVEASDLSGEDKAVLSEMLKSSIQLKTLVESSAKTVGGKTIIASLPFGFDIVK